MVKIAVLAAALCAVAAPPRAVAQAPTTGFTPGVGTIAGVDGRVYAAVVFNDGSGAALYVGGDFALAGGVAAARVARFNGVAWSNVGAGFDAPVRALAVHDDGTGPALYAGGSFATTGGAPAACVARWSPGTGQWSAVGGGVAGPAPTVYALTSFAPVGGGPAFLYAGGSFTSADGAPAENVAAWNGVSWSALGSGVIGTIYALAGLTGTLYAGGESVSAVPGGAIVGVRSWNGAAWSTVAGGLMSVVVPSSPLGFPQTILQPVVRAMAVHNDGTGLKLYVGGAFNTPGNVASPHLGRLNGAAWEAVGGGLAGPVGASAVPGTAPCMALTTVNFGAGPRLAVVGTLSSAGVLAATSIALWTGANFVAAPGVTEPLVACVAGNLGSGMRLFVGGSPLTTAGGQAAMGVASYTGSAYAPLGSGIVGIVMDAVEFDDGSGPKMYVCTTGGFIGPHVVYRRNALGWSQVGGAFDGPVRGLAVYDYGVGPRLFVSGGFSTVGGVAAAGVARWTGVSWVSTSGAPLDARDMAVYDDGAGARLYAVGRPAGSTTYSLAKYNGTAWTLVGGPLTFGAAGQPATVLSMVVHDDGTGPRLFCGGQWAAANGLTVNSVAAWNGASWAALSGPGGPGVTALSGPGGGELVVALAVHDARDGRGPLLYVGGFFGLASGVATSALAAWDGLTWSAVPAVGNTGVIALASFNDGAGESLYALPSPLPGPTGGFVMYKFSYGVWSGVATFSGETPAATAYGQTLYARASAVAPELWVGGYFAFAGGVISPRVAKLTRSAPFLSAIAQPTGPGSFELNLAGGPGSAAYFTALTFDPANAAAPLEGYWRGLHVPLGELLTELAFGAPPFVGALDAAGDAAFALPAGSLPPGIVGSTLFGVTHAFDAAAGAVLAHTDVFSAVLQ